MNKQKNTPKNDINTSTEASNGLTGIHTRIHCPATQISGWSEPDDELDRIAIDNFLDVLAQVALSIATRRTAENQEED